MLEGMLFNINDGYLEGICRGFRSTILKQSDYATLVQCETLSDLKLHLQASSYRSMLTSDEGHEKTNLTVANLDEQLRDKLAAEFSYMRRQSVPPLSEFLDYVRYAYMIDNTILLMTGTLNQRPVDEVAARCHPLGRFQQMEAVHVALTPRELYNAVIVDTPLAPFFLDCITEHSLNEVNVELIRNMLYKAYLESFDKFCKSLGGVTAETMSDILAFECDRRAFMITINSFRTELTKNERASLFPRCGLLQPAGLAALAAADNYEQVQMVAQNYSAYHSLFFNAGEGPGERTLEDRFFEKECRMNSASFLRQFHYGVFYSYLKLREQECRNIVWIAECISQNQRAFIENYIKVEAL